MKNLIIILLLSIAAIFLGFINKHDSNSYYEINSVLGDISFISKFHHKPDAGTDANLRIKTHLEYVENLLRQKDVSGMSNENKQKRKEALQLLHNYWTAARFPVNYDFADISIPCFIDKNGNICAVGFLIEKTAGRQVAEYINSKYKYEKIAAMNDPVIDGWISANGLTKEECAMIQPSYTPVSNNEISPAIGVSSMLLGIANVYFIAADISQIGKGRTEATVPILGLVCGAVQTTIGIANMPHRTSQATNDELRTVCAIDIGIGSAAIILSTWNLIKNKKPEEKKVSWNVYSFPTKDRNLGFGFALVRKF